MATFPADCTLEGTRGEVMQIPQSLPHASHVVPKPAERSVAAATQDSAHLAGCVAVIHAQARLFLADVAESIFVALHRCNLFQCYAITPAQVVDPFAKAFVDHAAKALLGWLQLTRYLGRKARVGARGEFF